jgi:hypothetical protein
VAGKRCCSDSDVVPGEARDSCVGVENARDEQEGANVDTKQEQLSSAAIRM